MENIFLAYKHVVYDVDNKKGQNSQHTGIFGI